MATGCQQIFLHMCYLLTKDCLGSILLEMCNIWSNSVFFSYRKMYKTLLNMWPKVSSWRLWIKIDVISYAIMIKHHFGAAKNSKYFYKRPARIETKNTVTKQGVRNYPSLWYFLIEVHDQWFQPETADQKSWVWTLCRPVNKDSTFPCFPP